MPSKCTRRKPIDQRRSMDVEAHSLRLFAEGAEWMEGQDEASVEPVDAPRVPLDAESLFVSANS